MLGGIIGGLVGGLFGGGGGGGADVNGAMQQAQQRADERFLQQMEWQEQNEANQHRMAMLQEQRQQSNQFFQMERESSADNHRAMMEAASKLNTRS